MDESATLAGLGRDLAAIAAHRATGWRLLADALKPPHASMIDALREGTWQREFRDAVAWLGDSTGAFEPSLMILDTFARRASRRSAAADLEALTPSWVPPVSDIEFLLPCLETLASDCEAEASAWAGGDHAEAKRLRVAESDRIERDLVPVVPEWCVAVDASPASLTHRALARLLASYLSVESGRDFDSALFPHAVLVEGGPDES
ncbi:hypothetical protein [Mobilicoccus caccae]|uniref:DUF222 domain-containing protein n=1 Tax=Mobilicoccus caccae TaxID=1859295 RepID=A0ABQ6IPA0_9MICO|nr:hypothetical protein [Mobilicoccus caccae]GMA39150.1 hypothetical protein GCM10025883_11950 [Mobilicoccus caccae]